MSDVDSLDVGPLEIELRAMRRRVKEMMPAETLEQIQRCIERVRDQVDGPKGLELESSVPDFVLSEAWGAQYWFKESLGAGPTVVVFYRGTWCPYCEVTLAAWQRQFSSMHEAGIQLVAISPQYPEATGEIVKKLGLEFPILCDPGNRVARKFGVVFKQEAAMRDMNELAGADLQRCNRDGSQELPIPGTFLVAQDSTLLYRHVDPDFTRRAEPTEVLARLQEKGA